MPLVVHFVPWDKITSQKHGLLLQLTGGPRSGEAAQPVSVSVGMSSRAYIAAALHRCTGVSAPQRSSTPLQRPSAARRGLQCTGVGAAAGSMRPASTHRLHKISGPGPQTPLTRAISIPADPAFSGQNE